MAEAGEFFLRYGLTVEQCACVGLCLVVLILGVVLMSELF